MITDIINGIFSQVMTATGIPIISDKQEFTKNDIPFSAAEGIYATYCILTDNPCGPLGDIVQYTGEADPSSGLPDAVANYSEENRFTISINVTSRKVGADADGVLNVARSIFQYMKRMSFPDATIRVMNTTVQERTAFLEAQFAYQYGFDVFIDIMDTYKITTPAIQSVSGVLTINPGNDQVPVNAQKS